MTGGTGGPGGEPISESMPGPMNRPMTGPNMVRALQERAARALIGDDVVAVGRAVADTGWAGVFGMATLPPARGKGAARAVPAALADWAGADEADRMYLQVERDNTPVRRLYERTGFTELCGYR
jgi:GNAT superfamily N-acetyltransferase